VTIDRPAMLTNSIPLAFGVLSLTGFSVKVDCRINPVSANRSEMTTRQRLLSVAALVFAAGSCAAGQTLPLDPANPSPRASSSASPSASSASTGFALENAAPRQPEAFSKSWFDFEESEIKFSLQSLMSTLRDGSHEGWVLAAYPDPKTRRPLIGAGFSLDLPSREHLQHDPLNPHLFVEPSSAELWQAAGLEPDRLEQILDRYNRDLKTWTTKKYRRKIRTRTLTPELTDAEAVGLLRISAIQAIYNAKAYCRSFDQMTGPQQMALSQLVFQMGVNLEEFTQFLGTLNAAAPVPASPQPGVESSDAEHWKTVQTTLINSQWARLYRVRASSVIAMFDAEYSEDPSRAQSRVEATLRPVAVRRRNGRSQPSIRAASYSRRGARSPHKANTRTRHKRKLG
jgi:hypothetical protein